PRFRKAALSATRHYWPAFKRAPYEVAESGGVDSLLDHPLLFEPSQRQNRRAISKQRRTFAKSSERSSSFQTFLCMSIQMERSPALRLSRSSSHLRLSGPNPPANPQRSEAGGAGQESGDSPRPPD